MYSQDDVQGILDGLRSCVLTNLRQEVRYSRILLPSNADQQWVPVIRLDVEHVWSFKGFQGSLALWIQTNSGSCDRGKLCTVWTAFSTINRDVLLGVGRQNLTFSASAAVHTCRISPVRADLLPHKNNILVFSASGHHGFQVDVKAFWTVGNCKELNQCSFQLYVVTLSVLHRVCIL